MPAKFEVRVFSRFGATTI